MAKKRKIPYLAMTVLSKPASTSFLLQKSIYLLSYGVMNPCDFEYLSRLDWIEQMKKREKTIGCLSLYEAVHFDVPFYH